MGHPRVTVHRPVVARVHWAAFVPAATMVVESQVTAPTSVASAGNPAVVSPRAGFDGDEEGTPVVTPYSAAVTESDMTIADLSFCRTQITSTRFDPSDGAAGTVTGVGPPGRDAPRYAPLGASLLAT